jgi:hypothetical protein
MKRPKAEENKRQLTLAAALSKAGLPTDEPTKDLRERWKLHYIGDPETPRKPCAGERGSQADTVAHGNRRARFGSRRSGGEAV